LDVVLSTTVEHVHVDSPMAAPRLAPAYGQTDSPADSRTNVSTYVPINFPANPPANPPVNLPADAPTDSPILATTEDTFVEALQVTPVPSDMPISGINVSCVSTALLPLPSSSPSGINAASKAALSNSTSLASTITPGSLVSLRESVDDYIGLPRTSTMQNQEDMKVMMDAMIARNRAGMPLDAHSVIEEDLPAEYCKIMATPETAKVGFERAVIHKLDGLHGQGHTTQEIVRQGLKEIQKIKDRLILIQSKTEAILTQNYELLEYTIPRLFIVLPETSTAWDPATMFRTKFRLRFICECGEHTKASRSKIPHQIHLSNHEGYVVNKPTEFFEKYGPFLMLMLEMIKTGTGIAGRFVPAVAIIDAVTSKGIDYSLKYLEECRALIQKSDGVDVDVDRDARELHQDLPSYLTGVEGLEGADLRQLGSYLTANSSDNLLGNLYRMTTKDGHVKWVCHNHYRAGYQEAHTQKLRELVKLAEGEFDEQLGRIEIRLGSSFAASEFYEAVSKARDILDLDVGLGWNQDYADFVKLKDMISKSNIRSLRMNLNWK
ncbi:hypothetical protein BGZ58_010663, partial [Dissophora ornata]